MKNVSFIILIVLISWACTETITDNPIGNQAPDSYVSIFPDSNAVINQQKSRLNVHWWGDDSDGLIAGYYFKWKGVNTSWSFTNSNDSLFSLPIGSADTTYKFMVSSADDQGNGIYDERVKLGDEIIGSEPYSDLNGNGKWDSGEPFTDIGLVDPTPATLDFPIKNTPPVIEWSELSVLPEKSFPVMTFGWIASDLDGDESITHFNLALNDTNNFVKIDGFTRIVTIRIKDFDTNDPKMEILLNGSDKKIADEDLSGIKLDDYNRIYLQAVDISGAHSRFINLPDTSQTWFVEKPKGQVLIVDDFTNNPNVTDFYNNIFDNIDNGSLVGKYSTFDITTTTLPYESITLGYTLNLFKYVYWYSDNTPKLEVISLLTSDYLSNGGKIAFSFSLADSSSNYEYNLSTLQSFLPISDYQRISTRFLFAGSELNPTAESGYPKLTTNGTIASVRTFTPNPNSSIKIHTLNSSVLNGEISFFDASKKIFFSGLPLHLCNGIDNSVISLFEKVFIEDFGLTP